MSFLLKLDREKKLEIVEAYLRQARDMCREAKAPMTLRKIRSAIKSVGGAIRHAQHDAYRQERGARVRGK